MENFQEKRSKLSNRPNGSPRAPRSLREPPTPEQFERVTLGIQHARSGARLVVKLTAALVATNAPALKRLTEDEIAAGVTVIELDLSACDRGDNRGLGLLVSTARACAMHRFGDQLEPVALVVSAISSTLRAQLEQHGLDTLLRPFDQPDQPFDDTPHAPEAYTP